MIVRSRMRAYVSWSAERRQAREVFKRYGVSIDPAATVADLRPVERALLAIVRAMEEIREVHDTDGLLVLDEPTVFLPREGTDHLFRSFARSQPVRERAVRVARPRRGSRDHRPRDGAARRARRGHGGDADASADQLVEMIIGRRMEACSSHQHDLRDGGVRARPTVDGAGGHRHVIRARDGEVLGLTGLMGSGFEIRAVSDVRRLAR